MNPIADAVHYPTSSDAELDRLQALCERLAGFDERVSLEWLDGAMTALAAGPRARPLAEWRERLLGEAWSRAIADPEDERASAAVLDARWRVLLRQLEPEVLMDAPDEIRLAPVMLAWTDEDRDHLVADGTIEADAADDEIPHVGEVWVHGFFDAVELFKDDWAEPADPESDDALAYRECLARIGLLAVHDDAEFAQAREELFPGEVLEREELVQEALYAVQDLRCYWVQNAPRPETRRVAPQPGRNDPCPCGSGKKFKKCHGA
jgi:uncharacterized protein